jgi:DNA uptake protein ComE-like DNA-binding protein
MILVTEGNQTVRLKQLALVVLCSGVFAGPALVPALAQTPAVPPAVPKVTAPTVPATPTMPSMPSMPKTTTPVAPTATTPTATMPAAGMTNINTASAADLDKLPQIGKARAAAIIKGRPYTTPDDLVSKKVLSKGVFDKIKDKITI